MGWRNGRCAGALLLGCFAILLSAAPGAVASTGTGQIAGTVTEASGSSPIENVEVFAVGFEAGQFGFAKTAANGEYTVTGLAPGAYTVEFYLPHESTLDFAPQYYNGASFASQATTVDIKAEGERQAGIDAKLKKGGDISGKVTNFDGQPQGEIGVFALLTGGAGEYFSSFAETNEEGEYTVKGLVPGAYTVEFSPAYESGINLIPQYYNEAPLLSAASKVAIATEGEKQTGIDAKLQLGGEISGIVTDAVTHKPLAGVEVEAENGLGPEYFGGEAETNANGEYTIAGLGNGSYNVEFNVFPFPGGIEYIAQSRNGVGVAVGQKTAGIDAVMVRNEPVNTTAPVVSGAPAVGQALSCANGSWTGQPKPTFTHTWLRNGSAILGATSSTYVVQAVDQGAGLACRVTARNGYGTASATSNTLMVPPVPPPPPPNPIVELTSSKLVVSGNSVHVPIVCAGETCTGTIELTGRIAVKHRRGRRTITKRETVVLARGSYSLTAGTSATITVHLTSAGRSALAGAKHHRLSAELSASVVGGATKSITAVLSEPAPKPKHRHGHRHG